MIWLIGMMGSGKSTIGRALQEAAGLEFADSDDEVERATGLTVRQLWERKGEAALRIAETEVVRRLAARGKGVVATGGGVVLDPANVEMMKASGTVVWLRAEPPVLAGRISGTARPLLDVDDVEQKLKAILSDRTVLYEDAADVVIETEGAAPADIVQAVLEATP